MVDNYDLDVLKRLNPVPTFDDHVQFFPVRHEYYVDGEKYPISVTSFVKKNFPAFNGSNVVDKMMLSKNWPQSKYYGKTKREILDEWAASGKAATRAGTAMHFEIELFFNHQKTIDQLSDTPEMTQFKHFLLKEVANRHWEPVRTELLVFDRRLKLAGAMDMLFRCKDDAPNEWYIVDWKRSKEIKFSNHWESGIGAFENQPNCNYIQYSAQVRTYQRIIERNTNIKINDAFIVVFHPNQDDYKMYRAKDLCDEIDTLFNQSLSHLKAPDQLV